MLNTVRNVTSSFAFCSWDHVFEDRDHKCDAYPVNTKGLFCTGGNLPMLFLGKTLNSEHYKNPD